MTRFPCIAVLIAGLMASAAPMAQAQTRSFVVDRCSTLIGSTFKPYITVTVDGRTTRFEIGENGLTNSTAFSKRLALAWARKQFGLSPGDRGRYSACGDFNFMLDFRNPL